MNLLIASLILFEVICNVAAQITLKVGMGRIGHFAFHGQSIVPIGVQVITSPWIIGGILIYVVSLVVWLMILSRTEVSLAYPLISLGYVLNALVAYWLLSEPITVLRLCGIAVILVGVFLVAKS